MGAGELSPLAPLTLTTVFGRTERGINALELFTARYKLRVSVVFNNNNNNTSICKAHNVSIRAESEAPQLPLN